MHRIAGFLRRSRFLLRGRNHRPAQRGPRSKGVNPRQRIRGAERLERTPQTLDGTSERSEYEGPVNLQPDAGLLQV